jgi:hypothetical protein
LAGIAPIYGDNFYDFGQLFIFRVSGENFFNPKKKIQGTINKSTIMQLDPFNGRLYFFAGRYVDKRLGQRRELIDEIRQVDSGNFLNGIDRIFGFGACIGPGCTNAP